MKGLRRRILRIAAEAPALPGIPIWTGHRLVLELPADKISSFNFIAGDLLCVHSLMRQYT